MAEPKADPGNEVTAPTAPGATPLRELAALFLKLGATAFGGPAAHIAMMEDEVVRRRGWLTHEEFLDMLGVTNLIPGPNSTEMAIHIGWRRARWPGLIVAGVCFILPATLIVLALAWAYVRYGARPEAAALFYGVKPVVIAVVLQALGRLGRAAAKTRGLAALGVADAVLNLFGVNELVILFGSGLAVSMSRRVRIRLHPLSAILPLAAAPAGVAATAAPFGLWPLFLFFLKVGSVLFGSGYVLLAFLRADLVERWHWMTESQLLDAIAVGQVTPGPVFTTATFIGYVLGGPAGAAVATVGIFLPAFLFVAASGPLVPRLRRSETVAAFLDGVNAASLALMAVVTWQLGRASIVDVPTAVLAVTSAALLIRFRVNSTWLILAGACLGLLASSLRHA
jgi:chromate transporter